MQHIELKNFKKKHFFEKKLVRFADSFYICMCVFHSIRFKVNKVLGHSGDPFFVFIPFKTPDFCTDSSAFSGKSSQVKTQKMRSFARPHFL